MFALTQLAKEHGSSGDQMATRTQQVLTGFVASLWRHYPDSV